MSDPKDHDGPRRPGQVKEITSLANPIIKDIKALAQKKNREASGTFMAEGLKLVLDALETGWKIETLIYSKAGKGKPLVEKAAARTVAAGGLVLEVSESLSPRLTEVWLGGAARCRHPSTVRGGADGSKSARRTSSHRADPTVVAQPPLVSDARARAAVACPTPAR